MKLNSNVEIAIEKLNQAGFEAYIVGGAARDFLLGQEPNDFDVCTNALPDKIQEVFKDYHCILNGLKHGTVSVVINLEVIEITTYRNDGEYKDHRHPESVNFVTSLKEDIMRRDFTINGLAYSCSSGVIDYVKGQEDLNNHIIRAIGDPNKRFNEDALRILRGIRFSATLDFEIEPLTKKAIFDNKDLLKDVAIERKISEFDKILLSSKAQEIINEYQDIFNLNLKTSFMETDDLEMRLAIVLIDNNLDTSVLRKMKYPNRTVNMVKKYITNINSPIDYVSLCNLKRIFEDDLSKLMILKKRYQKEYANSFTIENIDIYKISQLDISGDEIKCDNSLKGKALELLLNKVITKEIDNKKEDLQKYIKENIDAIS